MYTVGPWRRILLFLKKRTNLANKLTDWKRRQLVAAYTVLKKFRIDIELNESRGFLSSLIYLRLRVSPLERVNFNAWPILRSCYL